MPDLNEIDDRLKKAETTVGSWGSFLPELREWMHKTFDNSERAAEGVATLKKFEKRERADWVARWIALAAFALALFGCVYLCWNPATITQDVKQETNVERPLSNDEHHQQEVERQIDILNAERRDQSQ